MTGNILDCQKPLGQDIVCTCNGSALSVTEVLVTCTSFSPTTPRTTTYIPTTLLGNAANDVPKSPTSPALAIGISVPCLAIAAMLIVWYVSVRRRRFSGFPDWRLVPQHVQDKVRELLDIQYGNVGVHGLHASIYERLRLKASDLEVSSTLLGSGQFGFVWRGTLHPHHARGGVALSTDVAIKVLKAMSTPGAIPTIPTAGKTEGEHESESLGERALVQILLEARLQSSLKHEHLVQLLGVQDKYQPVMLVMQLCEAGDLRHVLRERSSSKVKDFNEVQQRDMAVQAASGLAFLHQHLCLHRDIAARNVLLTATSRWLEDLPPCGYVLKLSDLGMTRALRKEGDYYRSQSDDAVPIRWQCPEAVTRRVYTTKSDVYSYGILLYEIFSGGATPYASVSTSQVVRAVQAGQRLARPSAGTAEDIVGLIRDCTQLEVGQRPSMGHVQARLSPEVLLFVAASRGDPQSSWAAQSERDAVPLAFDFVEEEDDAEVRESKL